MKLSKRQKMMMGVLGIALGAFVIDAVLPGPSAASASTQPNPAAVTSITPSAAFAGSAASTTPTGTNARHEALMRVVERLRSVEPGDDAGTAVVPDPFASNRPVSLDLTDETPLDIEISSIVQIDEEPISRPTATPPALRITSIMNSPEGRLALVNGQLRREGDRIGEWVITRIAERSIRLSNGSHEMRVPMDR